MRSEKSEVRKSSAGKLATLSPASNCSLPTSRFVLPRLRFPEFRNNSEWDESRLGKQTTIVRGGSPRPIEAFLTVDPYGLNWLKIGDVDREAKYVTRTEERVRAEALSKTRVIHPGDFILSNSMSFGRPYISTIKTCIHDGWIAITEIPASLSHEFLYYSILSERSQKYFVDQAAGSGVQNLNKDIIKLLSLGIPSRAEQQKIADCLTSLDEVIAAQGRKVEALKAHKRGLMQQLFPREGETCPRLRFPEFHDAPEWEQKPLARVAENLDNKRVPITEKDRIQGDIPYYGASGVVGHVEGHIFDEDLLCISEDGANLVARTYPIAFSIAGKTWVNNHAHVLRFENRATQRIVEAFLNATDLRDFITGMAQPKLNKSMLDAIPIPLPDIDEQQRIADCLSSLDTRITAETNQLAALKTHKHGLMQQLFPSGSER